MKNSNKKITAHIPKSLITKACKITGLGITDTIRSGLKSIVQAKAYENLHNIKGSYHFSISSNKLRKDRGKK